MSIFFITGKPGGGKSFIAVSQICEELKDPKSNRFIVTNIQLNLPELANWCHVHCSHEVDLFSRIRILTDEETAEFWLYEPHLEYQGRKVQTVGKGKRQRTYDVPDFADRGEPGTLYVIDEVHVFFGSREWQQTGTDCTWFLTQHRKLGCDVVLVTQHVDQVDKALRRLAQEYMVVRNLSREPLLGFRIGSYFRFLRFLNSPNSPNSMPFESGFKPLDVETYGKLYDTTAGVGIAGRIAPKVEKRGRSLWWLTVPVLGLVLMIYYAPVILRFFTGKAGSLLSSSVEATMDKGGKAFSSVSSSPLKGKGYSGTLTPPPLFTGRRGGA